MIRVRSQKRRATDWGDGTDREPTDKNAVFPDFVMLVTLAGCLKRVICCYSFSHSKQAEYEPRTTRVAFPLFRKLDDKSAPRPPLRPPIRTPWTNRTREKDEQINEGHHGSHGGGSASKNCRAQHEERRGRPGTWGQGCLSPNGPRVPRRADASPATCRWSWDKGAGIDHREAGIRDGRVERPWEDWLGRWQEKQDGDWPVSLGAPEEASAQVTRHQNE